MAKAKQETQTQITDIQTLQDQTQERAQNGTVSTIKMKRNDPVHTGGPTTADVHPEEVETMKQAGWIEAQ